MTNAWALELLAGWEAQQTGFLPHREERFDSILECLGGTLGNTFTVLDVGCGPGSLTRRVLDAYPLSTVIALDSDPVLLAIGGAALTGYGRRLQWVDADLRVTGWPHRVHHGRIDGAVSTTALHWLGVHELRDVYHHLGQLVRPGGVMINGDNIPYDQAQPTSRGLAEQRWNADLHDAFGGRGVRTYETWWQEAEETIQLRAAVSERAVRRAQWPPLGTISTPHSVHLAGLSEAGFDEVTTVWQRFDDRVLLGVRSR